MKSSRNQILLLQRMGERKKIFWLVSWYPNKYDAFDGDFIQRHAKAGALYHDIHVLFVKASEEQIGREEVIHRGDGLTERLIYIPKKKGLRKKISSFRQWQQQYKQQVKLIVEKEKPSLLHVHIPWKAGLIALWARKAFNIPYLVTEHWGIYNNVVDDNIYTKSFLQRALLRQIYKKAAGFISVSEYLGSGVNKTLVEKAFSVIPNVVDTSLFFPSFAKRKRFTFLHVSNMVPLKNVEGILTAFKNFLQQTGADARLVLIGNKDDQYNLLAQKLGLAANSYSFRGEIPYEEVAAEMQRCHALVLNSNIENSPCVIGEALCCGLPVIATDVGGIPELLNEKNGLLISSQNDGELMQAMKTVYEHHSSYQPDVIASAAQQKFSMQTIGAAFSELYSKFL